MQWKKVSEGLPEIDFTKPFYAWKIPCIVIRHGQRDFAVYKANGYAKTETGKKPRWESPMGFKIESGITHYIEIESIEMPKDFKFHSLPINEH